MSAQAPSDEGTTAVHESDLAGIKSATQWLLGAFGGTALVVVAGIQLADAWEVISRLTSWRSWATLGGLVLVGLGLGALATAAARVLVPDRTNLTDLLTHDAMGRARAASVQVRDVQQGSPVALGQVSESKAVLAARADIRSDSEDVNAYVLGEISSARGWLLPDGCKDLNTTYQKFRGSAEEDREALRSRLREVAAFARAQAAFYRYGQLRRRLLGWAGICVFAGLVTLVLSCHAAAGSPVTTPTSVAVTFVADGQRLQRSGLAAACAGRTVQGVAVGGLLSEPEVILNGTPGCPQVKVTVTEEIGTALPATD